MKITVIVCTYNHEPYIAQALESILMQKVSFDYDVVVLDDHSTDRTGQVAKSYQEKCPGRIRANISPENKNDMTEITKAMEESKSPYLAFLDGDDFWTSPDKLQRQVDFLDSHPECALCFHNVEKFYEDGARPPEDYNPWDQKEFSTVEDLLPGCFIQFGSVAVRKTALTPVPEWIKNVLWGDWALYILAAHHGKLAYINDKMGAYRIHNQGFWSGKTEIEQLEETLRFYRILFKNLDPMYRRLTKEQLCLQYYFMAFAYERTGNKKCARKYLLKYLLSFRYRTIPLKEVRETWNRLWSKSDS